MIAKPVALRHLLTVRLSSLSMHLTCFHPKPKSRPASAVPMRTLSWCRVSLLTACFPRIVNADGPHDKRAPTAKFDQGVDCIPHGSGNCPDLPTCNRCSRRRSREPACEPIFAEGLPASMFMSYTPSAGSTTAPSLSRWSRGGRAVAQACVCRSSIGNDFMTELTKKENNKVLACSAESGASRHPVCGREGFPNNLYFLGNHLS